MARGYQKLWGIICARSILKSKTMGKCKEKCKSFVEFRKNCFDLRVFPWALPSLVKWLPKAPRFTLVFGKEAVWKLPIYGHIFCLRKTHSVMFSQSASLCFLTRSQYYYILGEKRENKLFFRWEGISDGLIGKALKLRFFLVMSSWSAYVMH